MGFAKYLEDNTEIWEERNRDRVWFSRSQSQPQQGRNSVNRSRNVGAVIQDSRRNNTTTMQKGV